LLGRDDVEMRYLLGWDEDEMRPLQYWDKDEMRPLARLRDEVEDPCWVGTMLK